MREGQLRAYMPGLVLLAGCLLLFQGTREQVAVPLAGPLDRIMAHVDGYTVQDQRVSDEERKVAGMSDYVARLYMRDTTMAFSTYVGYYERQMQGKTIHSPRNCLPGAGWEILESRAATVTSSTGPHVVNRYLLKNGLSHAVVYYWYQGRGRVVANEYTVKLNLLRDAALTGHTEEALVRIVLPVEASPAAQARADELGLRMASRLMDEVDVALPHPGTRSASRTPASTPPAS
ncbi:MAG: EpsI family protein [Gemmatimonadaceae bacterium]|nr:EpsI family protein [Gemmatimonadaceae bacterium]